MCRVGVVELKTQSVYAECEVTVGHMKYIHAS